MDLMLYGMGTVFIFLTVLVFATRGMSALLNRWQLEPAVSAVRLPQAAQPEDDQRLVAVISAAIHAHRQNNRK
jgi:oxaloacetate decarboxylase gamma subunit